MEQKTDLTEVVNIMRALIRNNYLDCQEFNDYFQIYKQAKASFPLEFKSLKEMVDILLRAKVRNILANRDNHGLYSLICEQLKNDLKWLKYTCDIIESKERFKKKTGRTAVIDRSAYDKNGNLGGVIAPKTKTKSFNENPIIRRY